TLFDSRFKTLQQNLLLNDEEEWGKLERRTKNKYKKLIKEISLIDLTDLMKSTLKANEKQLQNQIDFWQREFRFWK
ncbi:TPA: replication initiation protein, partial [Enterococcus faecalis]